LTALLAVELGPGFGGEGSAEAEIHTEWPFGAGEARRRQHETARALGVPVEWALDLGGGVSMEFVLVPAGRFVMASSLPSRGQRGAEHSLEIRAWPGFRLGAGSPGLRPGLGIVGPSALYAS
jgi:hypothetical protein